MVKVLAIFPAGIFVLHGMYKLVIVFFDSHRKQVIKAFQGIKKDLRKELGFMSKIKKEVHSF